MGLFDRLRGNNEEEVELRPTPYDYRRPPSRPRPVSETRHNGEVELRDEKRQETHRTHRDTEKEEADEFILPGMKPMKSESERPSTRRRQDKDRRHDSHGSMLEEVREQNRRIIELLEQIAGEDDGDVSLSPDMW